MSSIPGYLLEDYVAWLHDFVVNELGENNISLGMAEAMGTITRRPRFDIEAVQDIMDLYEPYRDSIESLLSEFDEECNSWRGFAGTRFDFIPDEVNKQARELLIKKNRGPV